MRKLLIVAFAFVSLTAFAQRGERSNKREMAKNLSAEEVATLQTKKMTLALALDDAQAKKVYPILLRQATDMKTAREARKADGEKTERTKEDRYQRANDRLDKRIAMQNEMKSILTEEQFEKFQKSSNRRNMRGKGKRTGRNHRGQRPQK